MIVNKIINSKYLEDRIHNSLTQEGGDIVDVFNA